MRLYEKGQISFVFLYVLNPIVILFYQNCAPSNISVASTITPAQAAPPGPQQVHAPSCPARHLSCAIASN